MIMTVKAVFFTKNGKLVIEKIAEQLIDCEIAVKGEETTLSDWAKEAFNNNEPLIFVGALGIAVRTVAPFINSKLTDPPVICIDEMGQYVIPILSGHIGGANELAAKIAELIGAVPVITTATDINNAFSVDLFAKENSLTIRNKDGIRQVSSKALEGRSISICIKDYPPKEKVDVIISDDSEDGKLGALHLSPKRYCLGVGCKKNTEIATLTTAVNDALSEAGVTMDDIYLMASIDLKKDEECLKNFSQRNRIPFITFEADMLKKVEGDFKTSEFVEKTVGVDNVCERSALLAAGIHGTIILGKRAKNGVTVAIAKRYV